MVGVEFIRDKFCEECDSPFYDVSYRAQRRTCSKECHSLLKVKTTRARNGYERSEEFRKKLASTFSEFVKRAITIHSDAFDYSKVIYINNRTSITIGCKACGEYFEQTPKVHLRGGKCIKCRYKRLGDQSRLTTIEFIVKAQLIHGDRYSYDDVEYVNSHQKVKITCNVCETSFMMKPNNHLNNHGCPTCARIAQSSNWSSDAEIAWLDHLKIPQSNRQIWINDSHRIMCVDALYEGVVYEYYGGYWHGDPRKFSPLDRNQNNGCLYGDLFKETLYRASLLRSLGYDLFEVWEYDWNRGMVRSLEYPKI